MNPPSTYTHQLSVFNQMDPWKPYISSGRLLWMGLPVMEYPICYGPCTSRHASFGPHIYECVLYKPPTAPTPAVWPSSLLEQIMFEHAGQGRTDRPATAPRSAPAPPPAPAPTPACGPTSHLEGLFGHVRARQTLTDRPATATTSTAGRPTNLEGLCYRCERPRDVVSHELEHPMQNELAGGGYPKDPLSAPVKDDTMRRDRSVRHVDVVWPFTVAVSRPPTTAPPAYESFTLVPPLPEGSANTDGLHTSWDHMIK
jgi:hypothetical protein